MRSTDFCWMSPLDLRHLQHLQGEVVLGSRQGELDRAAQAARREGPDAPPDCPAACAVDRMVRESGPSIFGRQDAANERAHHEQEHEERKDGEDAELDQPDDVGPAEVEIGRPAQFGGGLDGGRGLGKAQVDDLELVAALLVVSDGRAHERADAVEILLRARRIGDGTRSIARISAVDKNGDGDALDPPGIDRLGPRGAGYLVIDRLLALLREVLRAGRRAGLRRWRSAARCRPSRTGRGRRSRHSPRASGSSARPWSSGS